jgi:hypothetical protein
MVSENLQINLVPKELKVSLEKAEKNNGYLHSGNSANIIAYIFLVLNFAPRKTKYTVNY